MPDPIRPVPHFGHLTDDQLAWEANHAERCRTEYEYLAKSLAFRLAQLQYERDRRAGVCMVHVPQRPETTDAAFVPPEVKE